MECPACHLECPNESTRCDCGYDFKQGCPAVIHHQTGGGSSAVIAILNTALLASAVILLALSVGIYPAKPKQWEYTIVAPEDRAFETRMNELGQLGWEIVSARRATSRDAEGAAYEVILKRERR